ncbi:unnamed protein product, partial [Aphanomyces euteiches]
NQVRSTGNMVIVHEKQIALDLPNVAWHPSLDAIDISFIPSQESNAAPIWSRYVSSTVHTLHDTAGMHIRIHHRGAPVDIKDLQSNVTRVLIDLLGPSSSQIQPDAIPEWHIRATHLTLTFDERVLLNIQQVIESRRQGESVLSVTVSEDIAEAAKIVQSISSDSVSILKSLYSTEATSVTVSPEPTTRILDIDTTVSGSGFHQLLHVNVQSSHTDSTCRLLIEQPFPTTAYADMDELRRMERFNAFQVIALAKHIEIERPSALSSEHVVAFVMYIEISCLPLDNETS